MLDTASQLQATISLGHHPRAVRVATLRGLCQTIRADLDEHGPDPRLMMLGVALDYSASLLADAGEDEEADEADAALAQLGDELRLLSAVLRAALHRPDGDPALPEEAARMLSVLFPQAGPLDPLAAARGVLRLAGEAEAGWALEELGCRETLRHIDQALDRAEQALLLWEQGGPDELRRRARSATAFADGVLRRLLGHLAALLDPGDEAQLRRSADLLRPLQQMATADLRGWPAVRPSALVPAGPCASTARWDGPAYR